MENKLEPIIIQATGFNANLAPDAFHMWATHYQKCARDFQCHDRFSPVPYFLLCRAIELEIKSRHTKQISQEQVKREFKHNLAKAYESLDPSKKILSQNEERTLRAASDIYKGKGFEYFFPEDALTGYSRFPDLKTLDFIASKLIGT